MLPLTLNDILSFNSISNISNANYNANLPFPHIVIDNFLKDNIAQEINSIFPKQEDSIWYEYSNPIEKKFASDDIRKFPPLIAQTIHLLNSESFLKELINITGIQNLVSDPYLHGGGLHLIKTGGKLDMHLDYSIHPKLELQRRLNLILYMVDKDFKEEWGGELELWKGKHDKTTDEYTLTTCEKKVNPKFNRAVLFSTNDYSFHGHPEPLRTPEGVVRKSIALYYLTKLEDDVLKRPRARFIARPFEVENEELAKFRKERSSVKGIY
jgi:Rps23 Pro-64 3,4-dihydroxylase Tpa1-like proline 4-hydroxylase